MSARSYKKLILVYTVSIVWFVAINFSINMQDARDINDNILIILIALIPLVYTLIPEFKNAILIINRNKNRLTSDVFTDRKNDLEKVLEMLSSQDHIIEIRGREETCGKTWLAMRLCDYINNPKDKSLRLPGVKMPYKRAFYLDLQNYDAEKLNNFFNTNIILPKDVLIFDNVTNVIELISKQKRYHFQMIYVMKELKETGFSSHYVSEFDIENMQTLHIKLRSTYPKLEQLTKEDFDKLFELTRGNIGRIAGVLSDQNSIKWLKDIARGSKTEYDIELDKIQIDLFVGHYETAKEKLDNFSQKYREAMSGFIDISYKYLLMLSDCMHLLNNYSEALNILSPLETANYQAYNKNHEIELHKAHYYKHLWSCNEALDILYSLKEVSYSALVDSLGILAAKYFIDDLHVNFSDKKSIDVYKDFYICAENSDLKYTEAELHKLMRHTPVYEFYTCNNPDMVDLILHIQEIIDIYCAENNRLLANAYFIQGEIYRMYKEYDNAVISYKKCLNTTHDNNIIIQVNLMVYYIKFIKKADVNFNIITNEAIVQMCQKDAYADKVYHRINNIEINDPNAGEIINCIDTRIMPIL